MKKLWVFYSLNAIGTGLTCCSSMTGKWIGVTMVIGSGLLSWLAIRKEAK